MSFILSFLKLKVCFFNARKFLLPLWGWGLLLLLTSCEKVIDINLNNAAKKYVIEGIITNEPGFCKVQITQTVNFSEANTFPWVSGAIVTVTDNNNSPITLVETVAGTYQTSAINGTTGHAYRLSVNINGEVFSATSQMPAEVKFDSLFVEDFIGFGDIVKYANVVFKDPPGKGNAYRFKQYKNGLTNKTIFVINDDFSDGRINTVLLPDFANDNDDDKIKSGDTVKVDMQCIDARVYKYWFSLSQSGTGGNNNASPANPLSNITGGALGYFSAHTVQTKSVVVQ